MSKTIWIISPYPSQLRSNGDLWAMGWYTSSLVTHMWEKTQKDIVVFSNTESDFFVEQQENLLVDFCRKKWSHKFFLDIYKKIRQHPDIHVVHIQHEFSVFWSIISNIWYNILLFLLKMKWIKVVQTEHGIVDPSIVNKEFVAINNLPFPSWIVVPFFQLYHFINNLFVDMHIVHEGYFKTVFSKNYSVSTKKISVIPIGINKYAKVDKAESRKKIWIDENAKVLLYFWYIAWYKWLDLLIDAHRDLVSRDDTYVLIIAWWMPKRTADDPIYASRFTKLQINIETLPNSIRVGYVPDDQISTYFGAADVLVMPYKYMLAASWPMSLALWYDRAFLLSKAFDPVIAKKELIFDHNVWSCVNVIHDYFKNSHIYDDHFAALKETRDWKKVAKKTIEIYDTLKLI